MAVKSSIQGAETVTERVAQLHQMHEDIVNDGDASIMGAWFTRGISKDARERTFRYIATDDCEYEDVSSLYGRLMELAQRRDCGRAW